MAGNLDDRIHGEYRLKSDGERRIAQFFDACSIRYLYEQGVLVSDAGKPKIWHPDFYLPEFAAYVEYYGLAGNSDYDRGVQKKTRVYREMGLDVIPVYPRTFADDWQRYLLDTLGEITHRRAETLSQKRCYAPPAYRTPAPYRAPSAGCSPVTYRGGYRR